MSARLGRRLSASSIRSFPVLLAVLAAGCSDKSVTQPLTPDAAEEPSLSLLPATPMGITGCARILVSRSGKKDVSAEVSVDPSCGLLSVLVDSVDFDNGSNRVTVHVHVENAGPAEASAPVLLASWPDSVHVVTPPGLAGNRHSSEYLTQVDPDSAFAPDDPDWPGANVWMLDIMAANGGAPGSTQVFGPAALSIVVHPGVHSFEIGLRLRADQVVSVVPDEIPEALPSDLMDHVDPEWGAPVDYLPVMFKRGTSTEEKTRVVSLIAGQVTGGRRFFEGSLLGGYYLVKIPTDGTLGPLLAASELLRVEPAVLSAEPLLPISGDSRSPDDGGTWSEWQTDPYLNDGDNWAQEMVGAPLAWGCTTGDPTVPIAIIDDGFRELGDLVPNVRKAHYATGLFIHGGSVASVLAARGDNQQGMTGMMWNAGLNLIDLRDTTTMGMTEAMEAAIRDGAKIVNISRGLRWGEYRPSTQEDSTKAFDAYDALRKPLRELRDTHGQTMPLMVLSAGNDHLSDARWNGYPRIADDFPDNVIVVGSVSQGRPTDLKTVALASSSNFGDVVDLAAPGDSVSVLVPGAGAGTGAVDRNSGTSFSAPMVAGVAGLLLSFDPTIPVDQLKALIMEGALRDGFRTVPEGLPVLHAYGALKAAARRSGAPVCGNTVVADGTQILVDRDDRWDGIGNSSVPSFGLAVQHGSRAIDILTPSGPLERAEFSSGNWSVTPGPAPDPGIPFPPAGSFDLGGFSRSQGGQSDDGLAFAVASRRLDAPVDEAEWGVMLGGLEGIREVYRHHQGLNAALDTICTRKYVARDPNTGEVILTYCNRMSRIYRGESAEARASLAPQGGRIYLTVVISVVSYSLGGWAPCGFEVECLSEISSVSSARSHVHEIDIAEETAREVFQVPHAIYRLGVSEDGKDIVFGRYDALVTSSSTSITRNWFRCTVEVHDARSGQLRRTAPFERSCFSSSGGGGPFDVPILSFGHGS